MKKFLVLIDFQNDFIDGSLGNKEAVVIMPNVLAKLKEYQPEERLATMDTHFADYLQTQEGRNLPIVHAQKGSFGWQLPVDAQVGFKQIFEKSTFGSIELAEYIRDEAPDQVELIGLDTDICIISNVVLIKNYAPEVRVLVDAKATAGVSPNKYQAALETMRSLQVEILNAKEQ